MFKPGKKKPMKDSPAKSGNPKKEGLPAAFAKAKESSKKGYQKGK